MKVLKKSSLLSLILIAMIIMFTACSSKPSVKLSAKNSEMTVIIGESIDLGISATDVGKYTEEEILSNLDIDSSDDAIVKVDDNGITAVGIGTANVTATWKENSKTTVTVAITVVAPEVGEVTYSEIPANVYVNDEFTITFEADEKVEVIFETSNSEVLTVDGAKFKAIAAGEAKITATASNGYKEIKNEWNVTVIKGEYTITYVLNGGVNATNNPAKYDARDLPLLLGEAQKENKQFLGWTLEENSTNYVTEIAAGTQGDITLYAHFADIVNNITYELNGGTLDANAPKTYVQGVGVELVAPTKDGYEFVGWTLEESSTDYITEISDSQTGDVKLYAQFANTVFNITYELNGGTLDANAPKTYEQGIGVALVAPTKDGYKFLGWTLEESSTNYITEISASQTGDVKLYAQFANAVFNISYELNGGTLDANAPKTYEQGVGVALVAPTKDGYKFLGWTKEAESTKYITKIDANEAQDITLYAQWKEVIEGVVYVGAGLDYATLDEAIDNAKDGYKIILGAGEYTLKTIIKKSIEIIGPNADLEATALNNSEAVINIAVDVAGNLAAKNVVFNGVHLKGTGGGAGIPGIFFQDGGSIESLTFKSCVVSDMNTFIKFFGGTSNLDLLIEDCYFHTIGQFIIWVTSAINKTILRDNYIDGSTCGAVTNDAAALFRIRFGSIEAYNNYFNGDSLNVPGYFECSAQASIVKYNTFNNVTRFVHPTAQNSIVFDENLYLDANGQALEKAPTTLTGIGVTADKTVVMSAQEVSNLYMKYLILSDPERYFAVTFDAGIGTITSMYPYGYDTEVGIESLPSVELDGYQFLGWYLNDQKVEFIPAGTTGELTLVAKWKEEALVVDGTTEDGHYKTLADALAAAKPGEIIKLVAGEYTQDVTINTANLTIKGPNSGIDANTGQRVEEAVIKCTFNVTSKAGNLTIDGLAFTGNARIAYSESTNYDGFIFKNNKVYDTVEATKAWNENRYELPGFIQFTMASGGAFKNIQILNNSFVNVSEINILANRAVNMTVDGNVFKDFDQDAIRIEGGYSYGVLSFTNNIFEQTVAENGYQGIFLYSIAGSSDQEKAIVLIENNSFIKLGSNNGTVFTGAVSAYRFQENYTTFTIKNNIFDHCYDYLYLRNNGGDSSNWFCTVENNQFLGLPQNQYYGSYRGTDTESTNPHLAVFTSNYYEDNDGNVITDLSAYSSFFKHMASYGNGLASKPDAVVTEPVIFWNINYDLNGGETTEQFVYTYNRLVADTIVLPEMKKDNHNFNGWLLDGVLVSEIPADAKGDLYLIADFTVLEGELYGLQFVANQENPIWPSRAAVDRQEIISELYADLYEWALSNGETKSYADYIAYIEGQLSGYSDIKLRNTTLGNYPAEDGSTEYFFNVPKYYQKWNEFFGIFHTAMIAVNPDQSFYKDTYATMVRLYQFITWSSSGQSYFSSYLSKMYAATKVQTEVPTSYRGGETFNLPVLAMENGLEFLGWYDNPEFKGEKVTALSATDTGDKVFYAKWAEEVKVETIEINKISELLLFTTHQLVWTIAPDNVTNKNIEFFSSDESIATVSTKGLITALAKGTVTITVRVYGNRELDFSFDVAVFCNDYIEGSYETTSYAVAGQDIKLNASIVYRNDTVGKVKWVSLNPEIATVDENGLVSTIKAGVAKIVAVDPNNEELKLEFSVTVLEEEIVEVLAFLLESHEDNVFTRYNLGIGSGTPVYYQDIFGSVSKILMNEKLVIDDSRKDKEVSNKTGDYYDMSSLEFITVHYTGNMSKGADAEANANYFVEDNSVSIHYTTGNDGIYQALTHEYGAWHAGDSGALSVAGEFKWTATGVKVGANDPQYPVFTISDDFYYEINGQKTSIEMAKPWNYESRNTDHILNSDGTISSKAGFGQTAFKNRTPESFINDQGLPFKIVDGEYYMGTTWWCYTQVYEGRICSTGGNRNSIGIESCVDEGSDLWYTWQLTAKLVAKLMYTNNLDITRVRGHHFYSAKDCPQPMLENDLEIWWEFISLVEAEYELLTKYSDYEIKFESHNPDILDNNGRIIKQPNETTCVSYTITVTKDGVSKSITLSSIIQGLYVNR